MITNSSVLYEIPRELPASFPDPKDVCFLDVESSGYGRKNASLAYAGVLFPENGFWTARQWITESREEENSLLLILADVLKPWPVLAHFGGTGFDLPFLKKKWASSGLTFDFSSRKSLDIYLAMKPFQKLWGLPHMDERTLEGFLGLTRGPEDNDLTMLPKLLPLLCFADLAKGGFTVTEARPLLGDGQFQLEINLKPLRPLPVSASRLYGHFYLKAGTDGVQLLVYGFSGTLRYFFPDYRNYCYLPAEDQAIHKSVAAYVDKENRVPAKAATCYTKKAGSFLPRTDSAPGPFFQKEYKDTDTWFLFTESWAAETENIRSYAADLLSGISSH